MSIEYIRDTYKVPAYVGMDIEFQGKPGIIKGAKGSHLKVLLNGDKNTILIHPTWEVVYNPVGK